MAFFNQVSLKTRLLAVLWSASLGATLIIGGLSWWHFRKTFQTQTFEQLTSLRAAKGQAVETYIQRVRSHVETLSEDQMVIAAMVELGTTYQALQNEIIPIDWTQKIERYYTKTFLPNLSETVQGEQIFDNYRAISQASQYLQYHYIANNAAGADQNRSSVTVDDDSDYSQQHRQYHPLFANLIQKFDYTDLFLINFDTEDIVYSVQKRTDYATNLARGPYRRSNLATVVAAVRENPGRGFVQVVDFKPHAPLYAAPTAFFAAPIYNGPHIVGIVAVQLSGEGLDRILMGNKDWQEEGLGETGQLYVVGPDLLMRSTARTLIEEPDRYKKQLRRAGLSAQTIDLVEKLNTSILLQPVQTTAAEAALAGNSATQVIENFQGTSVLSAYAPLKLDGLKWGILVEIEQAEAMAPVYTLMAYLGTVAVVVLLLMIWGANWVAQLLTRPLQQFTVAATQLEAGQLTVDIPQAGQDEFAQFGQVFAQIAQHLRRQTDLIDQHAQSQEQFLHNLWPAPVVTRWQRGDQEIMDQVPQVTVLQAKILGLPALAQATGGPAVADILQRLFTLWHGKAEHYGIESLHTVDDSYRAICGLSKTYFDHSERMVNFVLEMQQQLQTLYETEQVDLGLRVGIHAGPVTAGMVGSPRFTYKVWGETVDVVTRLNQGAGSSMIVVTQPIYECLQDRYVLVPYPGREAKAMAERTWLLVANTGLLVRQVTVVEASWQQTQIGRQEMTQQFYGRLCEPGVGDGLRSQLPDTRQAQQDLLTEMVDLAVKGVSNPEQLSRVGPALRRRFADYGLMPGQYSWVRDLWLQTLAAQLGADFTPSVDRAWRSVLLLIGGAMAITDEPATVQS